MRKEQGGGRREEGGEETRSENGKEKRERRKGREEGRVLIANPVLHLSRPLPPALFQVLNRILLHMEILSVQNPIGRMDFLKFWVSTATFV